jgi:large subunit ribosomal protein L17
VRPLAEQMITLGRRGDLHARRQATAFLRSRDVVHHLFAVVAPRFEGRPGGYTRIVKIGPRPGDSAEMAYLELVDEPVRERPARPASRTEREAAPVPAEPAEAQVEAPETEAEASEEPVAGVEAAAEGDTAAEEPAAEAEQAQEPAAEAEEPGVAEPDPDAPAS